MSLVHCIHDFLNHKTEMDNIERRGEESYSIEFLKLRDMNQKYKDEGIYPTSEGSRSCNASKNRFKDILPYDHCRVRLTEQPDVVGSDYINASYIKGAVGNQQYIAAQGPLPKTVKDFWKMIWENEVRVIVMACQEYEGTPPKLKCQRYWAMEPNEVLEFDDITVSLIEDLKTDGDQYVVRRLSALKGSEDREIIHLHYTKWPDKFIPKCKDSILYMLETIRTFQPLEKQDPPPLLVHCSAGCGRTGTILVIDYIWSMLKFGKITKSFSLFEVIAEMRRQRMAIVQSLEQYVFVHEIVAELFTRQMALVEQHNYDNVQLKKKPSHEEDSYELFDYSTTSSDPKKKDGCSNVKNSFNDPIAELYARPKLNSDSSPSFKKDRPHINKKNSMTLSTRPVLSAGKRRDELSQGSLNDCYANVSCPNIPAMVVNNQKRPIKANNSDNSYQGQSIEENAVFQPDCIEYAYAEINSENKWSLQAIAIGKDKIGARKASIPTDAGGEYAIPENNFLSLQQPPRKNTTPYSDESGAYAEIAIYSKAQDCPGSNQTIPVKDTEDCVSESNFAVNKTSAADVFKNIFQIGKQQSTKDDRKVVTMDASGRILFKGEDIGFPNRVRKPKGKRPLVTAPGAF